jgi:hypothetical protein
VSPVVTMRAPCVCMLMSMSTWQRQHACAGAARVRRGLRCAHLRAPGCALLFVLTGTHSEHAGVRSTAVGPGLGALPAAWAGRRLLD